MATAPPRRSVRTARILAVRDGARRERPDRLAAEEPMEIRAGGPGQEPAAVAVTMRTPGHDFELAAGFLLTEGLIGGPDPIAAIAYCALPEEEQRYNVVTVRLRRPLDTPAARAFPVTSSCGICGRASLDAVEVRCAPIAEGPRIPASTLLRLPDELRRAQRLFEATGGLHAAGLFDRDGRLAALREDVGRHNAVDKLVGRALLAGALPLSDAVMLVSGRLSFELVQKAAVAGVPVVCAVSAPSSLAVDAAERLGMTAVGFLRERGFNVYAGAHRIQVDASR
jgi:FdhD protein